MFHLTTSTGFLLWVQTISFYHKINKANKQDMVVRLFLPQLQFVSDAQLSQGRSGLPSTDVSEEQKGTYICCS